MDVDDRHRPRRAAAEDAVRAVGQCRVDAAFDQAGVDAIQNFVEAAAEEPRQQPAPGRESAVGGDQVTASG